MPESAIAWGALIVAFIGSGGLVGWASNYMSNRTTREKDWYDQLQEDRDKDRAEIASLRSDVDRLKGVDKAKDDYISALRHQIESKQPPPPVPWPAELRGGAATA